MTKPAPFPQVPKRPTPPKVALMHGQPLPEAVTPGKITQAPPVAEPTIAVQVRIPVGWLADLGRIATSERRTRSAVIRNAIEVAIHNAERGS